MFRLKNNFCAYIQRLKLYANKTCAYSLLPLIIFALQVGCGFTGYQRWGGGLSTKPVYHRVEQGDTIYKISRLYGVSSRDLAIRNGLHDAKRLTIGQRLLVAYRSSNATFNAPKPNRSSYDHSEQKAHIYKGGRLGWPVSGGRLVSRFGRRGRSHHDGIDIAAQHGTPVIAAHNGVVVYSGNRLRGYGNLIILRDHDGLITVYAHNRRLLTKKGKRIKRGQKIAEVGSTGRATGAHLHFEVRAKHRGKHYVTVDPLAFFNKSKIKNPRYRRNDNLTPLLAKATTSR